MLLGSAVWFQAADWPNWRGPDHNGISQETGWFEKWGSSGPKRLWNASVGTGFATVSVADGRVFTMGHKSNRDTVYALEDATGDILWRHSYSEALNPRQYDGGPNTTPTVDGEYVYTLSKTGKAFCLEVSTGDEVWNKDLKKLYSVTTPNWGFASSPLIHGDKVVYNVGSRGIALNKKTGNLKWKTGSGKSGYATPVPYDHRGTEAFIMFGSSSAYGVNAATGKQLWSKSFKTSASVNAADPVLYDGKIFLTSNTRDGELIELSGTSTSSKWKNRNMRIHFNPGVVIGDYFYGADGRVERGNTVRCINMKTGKTEWTKSGITCASITASDGKLIILSRNGDLYIADTGNHVIRRIAAGSTTITTVAGTPDSSRLLPNATQAFFCIPTRLARMIEVPWNRSRNSSSVRSSSSTRSSWPEGPTAAAFWMGRSGDSALRFTGHTSWQMSQPKIWFPVRARSSLGIGPRSSIVR